MKMFLSTLIVCFMSQAALASGDSCHRHVASDLRSQNPEGLVIESIDYIGTVAADEPISTTNDEFVTFSSNGHLYVIGSEFMSGTAIDWYLVDSKCEILERMNVYSE